MRPIIDEKDRWRFIEENLPNYSSRHDVFVSNTLTKYVDEPEDIDDEDKKWIISWLGDDIEAVKKEIGRIDSELFEEAMAAYRENHVHDA